MSEYILDVLSANGVSFIYSTVKVDSKKKEEYILAHFEMVSHEEEALELALSGSLLGSKTACLVTSEGLYQVLESLAKSAYYKLAGGFLIIAVQENDEEVTPLAMSAILPLIIVDAIEEFEHAIQYGFSISERYNIPLMVQTPFFSSDRRCSSVSYIKKGGKSGEETELVLGRVWEYMRNLSKYNQVTHEGLALKIEHIRSEFEHYQGNIIKTGNSTGVLTDRSFRYKFYDEDSSLFKIATVYPLPMKAVTRFIDSLCEVFLAETYPVIELQIPHRSKLQKGISGMAYRGPRPEETIFGFQFVRDKLGPASSINMAYGIKKCAPEKKVLAITYEEFFFRSGIPAFLNALQHKVCLIILILTSKREGDIKRILNGFNFNNYFTITGIPEINHFYDAQELTVLFCKGVG